MDDTYTGVEELREFNPDKLVREPETCAETAVPHWQGVLGRLHV